MNYPLREKLFRQIMNELSKINKNTTNFYIKVNKHFVDRIIDRNIDQERLYGLLWTIPKHSDEILKLCEMPPQTVTEELSPNTVYRPLRLEITDGALWLGFTFGLTSDPYNLQCRTVVYNPVRKPGKIDTKIIRVNP